ncbi:MAG: CPBP family intramembrane metalloprotease [Puniceicoccales bacterium]|nr:CPBP family intramembrane metalloprotease [Puniceicoccales bacterium]
MTESPLGILIAVIAAVFIGRMWWQDFSDARKGTPNPKALPGATPSSIKLILIGIIGAVLLTALETIGELALGISGEQKNISVLFLGAMLAAALLEEIIFRGYIVITNRGRTALIASILGASLVFALAHDFLWQFSMPEGAPWWQFWQGLSANFTLKGWFSFGFVFLASLFFYGLRFHPKNVHRSLLPCFAAHAAKNIAVFLIKLAQGHVAGLY